jgi:hypothetical protein
LKTLISVCPHFGQSKTRLSNPGLSVLIRVDTIGIEHVGSAHPLSMPVAEPNSARFVACPDRCIATDDAAAPAHTLLSASRDGAIRGSGSAWIAV